MKIRDILKEQNLDERSLVISPDMTINVKKLWQYINRNLVDLASMANFEKEASNQPYVEERLSNLLKTPDGRPVTIAFDGGSSIDFKNNVLYVPIEMMYKYRHMIPGTEFVKEVLALISPKQGVAEGSIENLDEGIMDFISKAKDKFLRLKDALSDEWAQSKEMWRIVAKGNTANQKEINFANAQFKDILRVVGLSAWYSLPIPGNTLLILATEKLLNKVGMSIIPDKIRNQVLMSKKQGVAEGVTQDFFNKNFSQIDSVIKQNSKKILDLLIGMFPNAKEAIVNQYNDEEGPPFAEWRRVIYEIDDYVLSGPVMVNGSRLPIDPESEADRLAKYQQYIQDKDSGRPARYFRVNDSDPRTIDFSKLPPITLAQTDRGMQVTDGNHRAFLAKMANKPLRAYVWKRQSNNHPNAAKIKSLFSNQQGVAEGAGKNLSVEQLAAISDAALDQAYGYGRSTPGKTFGWQANLMSAAYAKKMIDAGVTDIERIADAIHRGWNVTAQKFVQDPDQFADTEKLRAAGKLEAKLDQRAKLMRINYAQLPDDEQEKDRVVGRALLQALTGNRPGENVWENFADGKVKGRSRPGRVKRSGASCKGSVSDLRARAKKYGGERGRMYHWCANMKSGKKKSAE